MDIILNGQTHDASDDATVADLLAELELRSQLVAVEVNRQLVPRDDHATCRLHPGDELEIVTLVGGG